MSKDAYKVFELQTKAAEQIHKLFHEEKKGHVFLMAQMQSGKTGVATEVIRLCIETYMKQAAPVDTTTGRMTPKFEVIWVSCPNDLELAQQSRQRISLCGEKYGFRIDNGDGMISPGEVRVMHHKGLNNYTPNPQTKYRLVILDECHIGQNKQGEIDKFLKKIGVVHGDPNPNPNSTVSNYVLRISATPWMEINENNRNDDDGSEKWMKRVDLEVDDKYTGLEKLMASGRVHDVQQVLDVSDKPTQWLLDRANEHAQSTIDRLEKGDANPHRAFLIRMTDDRRVDAVADAISKAIQQVYDDYARKHTHRDTCVADWKTKIYKFGSSKRKGLLSLRNNAVSNQLKQTPSPHYTDIVVIRAALRQGSTVENTQWIGTWIDTYKGGSNKGKRADAMAQSVGRLCGYGREHDICNIYCDTSSFNEVIETFKNHERCPTPDGNNTICSQKLVGNSKVLSRVRIFDPNDPQLKPAKDEAGKYYRQKHINKSAGGTATASEQNNHDVNGEILRVWEKERHRISDSEYWILATRPQDAVAYHLDGPNENYPESWLNVPEELRGMEIVFCEEKPAADDQHTFEDIPPDQVFRPHALLKPTPQPSADHTLETENFSTQLQDAHSRQ